MCFCRCLQHSEYELAEEAVRRYDLFPEEVATLQLAVWVDGSSTRLVRPNDIRANFALRVLAVVIGLAVVIVFVSLKLYFVESGSFASV
jgi:hypothetical protein